MITEDLLKMSSNQVISFGEDISDVSNTYCSTDNEEVESGCMVTPGGHKYYVLISLEDNLKPFICKSFQSLEFCIAFYSEYELLSGFTVRRSAEKTHSDEGSKSKVGKRRRTMSERCGCEAKLVLKYSPGNIYFVYNFIEAHNHPLVPEDSRHFLKGSRKMSTCSMNFVFDASKVNIGTMKSFRMMKELLKGYENVGATSREFRNFDRDLKVFVGVANAQMIIEKFKVKQETYPCFFYDVDVDHVGNLTKLFWADSTARRNYDLYGDAVSFDPTFNTNKYNMVFAPFTGVDKHNKCVTFASTLLSKEDVPHFTWAFEALLKAMGRNPVCIVTDQCAVMKQAIPNCFKATNDFPVSRHRLCMWHITEKFPEKLGHFLCKETEFMEKIKKYIWSSVIEPDEFEQGWKEVMKEFKLEEHVWLSEMYDMRESWIPAYFRDKQMYGLIRTTLRSESENCFFSQFHQNGSTLSEFYIRFESAMDKQHAAELYNRAIFYEIQEEILAARDDMRIQTIGPEINGMKCYEMKDVKIKDKIFQVEVSRTYANCSCKKFLMCGILCRHTFCALNHFEVAKIPRRLVLNRWKKNAENKASLKNFGVSLRSEREKAVTKLKKRKRECTICRSIVHDKRTFPQKMKVAGAEVQVQVQTEFPVLGAEVEKPVSGSEVETEVPTNI
ncbi:hypothetical protein POM88_015905 [Heracleum sosnowskyi]|uniref:SWIM-type domain-containing protein n=1 Tax=Heracleum sosnowskyi TaxID=360622 RepID=A0AAD8IL14_9APIA|nr:hypothetical protein POM88_015905 [Heracleum sosnowskyi]